MNRITIIRTVSVALLLGLTSGCDTPQTGSRSSSGTTQVVSKATPIPDDQFEEIPNPLYQNWADFPVGTVVKFRDLHQHENNRTESIKVLKLVELTADLAVVEEQITTVYPDGRKDENPPMRHEHGRLARVLKGTDPKSVGRGGKPLEEGTETLNTPLGELPTSWYTFKGRVDAGEIHHKVWNSKAVPGGVVRVESRVPAINSLTVVEVIEVSRPPVKN
jgi:hypothetical protein